ncbi:MAG: sugar ABC transporter permease, partial [Spirochaetae bacterium HGW-Spirochaetae-8]
MNTERRLHKDTRSTIALFLIPAFVLYLVLVVFPIFQSARYSLYSWDGLGPLSRFVGLENYRDILNDAVFWQSFKNNMIVVFFSLITQMPAAV